MGVESEMGLSLLISVDIVEWNVLFENIEELQENHIYVIMRLWCKTNSQLQWGKRNQFEEGETSTICIST